MQIATEKTEHLKEKQALQARLDMANSKADDFDKRLRAANVKVNQFELDIEKAKADLLAANNQITQLTNDLRSVKIERGAAEAELRRMNEANGIGSAAAQGESYDALVARNRKLEEDNRVLEMQKATIIAHNKELGTFEYIGQPMELKYGTEGAKAWHVQ